MMCLHTDFKIQFKKWCESNGQESNTENLSKYLQALRDSDVVDIIKKNVFSEIVSKSTGIKDRANIVF